MRRHKVRRSHSQFWNKVLLVFFLQRNHTLSSFTSWLNLLDLTLGNRRDLCFHILSFWLYFFYLTANPCACTHAVFEVVYVCSLQYLTRIVQSKLLQCKQNECVFGFRLWLQLLWRLCSLSLLPLIATVQRGGLWILECVCVCLCVCRGLTKGRQCWERLHYQAWNKKKNCNVEHQSDTPQRLCNIGFHIINLQPLLLSLWLVTHSTGHWLTGWCQYFNVRMHNLTLKWGEHFILNEAVWKCEHRKWKRRRDSPVHSSYPLMEHKWINWEMGEGKIGSCKKNVSVFFFFTL